MKAQILLVDDEPDVRQLLHYNLNRSGFEVTQASDGISGFQAALRHSPDLIVLDIMMPGRNGYQVFRDLRADSRTRDIPVLMLTAKGHLEDRINGLELGVDDYVSKPFSPKELVLRIHALLRRSHKAPANTLVTVGPFHLNKNTLHFFAGGQKLDLTPIEFKLMVALMERLGQPQARRDLLREIWGYSDLSHTRTLDTHVKRLREKLDGYSDWIQTVRGIGYCLKEP